MPRQWIREKQNDSIHLVRAVRDDLVALAKDQRAERAIALRSGLAGELEADAHVVIVIQTHAYAPYAAVGSEYVTLDPSTVT
jgi:hypothetical protein